MSFHTRIRGGLLTLLCVVTAHQARAQDVRGAGPGGRGPGGGGPGVQPERKVLAQFDRDGNKRLDAVERRAARDWLATEPAMGRGGPGGPGGRAGPGMRGGPGGGRGGMAPGTPGQPLRPADVKTYPATTTLYDVAALRTVFLQFEAQDWEQELEAFHNTDVEVAATATVDGVTYTDVGVHFRGNSSYMMVPAGLKRSLNLAFDFADDTKSLLGYRTLNLLNAANDASLVRTLLFARVSNAYLPTPKVNYMRVVINGENWGVYLNVQQFNKDFLRDHGKATESARWKVPGSPGARGGMEYLGDDPGAYRQLYEIKSKDDPKRWADLIAMFRTLNTTPPDQLEAALAGKLDVDNVLRFLAVDNALVNSDGYWTRASDYAIYQDPAGKFSVLPLDMNEALDAEGGRGRGGPPGMDMRGGPPGGFVGRGGPPGGMPGGPGGPGGRGGPGMGGAQLDPLVGLDDASKPLRSKLLAVPAFRARYLGYVREIAEHWLDWKTVGPIVEAHQALIAADVAVDTRKLFPTEQFAPSLKGGEGSLQSFLERRRAYLLTAIPR